MIPLRIQLAGFLCYREPQEACFEGRTLWMLAGPNGSGKSALFDAMTFVLFGQHRGGKQNSRGLIHHDCDRLTIEFDFQLDSQLYRARRTLSRRGRSTRQILARSDDGLDEPGIWTVVPETHTERGFSQWINANIALTYDSFTASVLLLQGKADNLLLATPAQRHRLLCHIVGIDRIEELAKQARHHLSQTDGTVRACRQQVQQLTPDEKACVAGLRQQVSAADHRFTRQHAEVERIRNRLEQATRWQHLTTTLTNLETEIAGISEQLERGQQSDSLQRRLRAAQQDCRLWKRITKLLGQDGLQRALLESTEREIVQYTNTILDRLSGGQLFIELAQSNSGQTRNGKALELVARTTGASTHEQEVAFLSGSQKFRVAVALSLAIGQFASNTRRPVQAVIIDEGFGCLDTANRHVMIQELQNLRGHLQRILLVSHQDEFASAFSDGYRCELVNGATQLTPFHA